MRVEDIARILPGARCINFNDAEVNGIAQDSRRVKPGNVFVAIQGSRMDGHQFVREAAAAGAAACVCERPVPEVKEACHFIVDDTHAALSALAAAFCGHPSKEIVCVGVTGTDGKTSTSSMLRDMLDGEGGAGLTSTVCYRYGGRKIPADRTTPDAVTLQELLRSMASQKLKYAVLEVSSHALVQKRTDGIDFKVGVLTNLSPEHLDYHRTLEEYRDAKALLFKRLPKDGWAVLNADDPASEYFEKVTNAEVVKYGTGGAVEADIIKTKVGSTVLRLLGLEMNAEVKINLTGRHNVQNVLAACCAARVLGVPPETVKRALADVSPVPGRLEVVRTGLPYTVLVDYAHTPRALRSVLEVLRPLCEGRLILVFGCGGDRDRSKRPRMGKIGEELADVIFVTSDNPRSEEPLSIIDEILSGLERPKAVNVDPDRDASIRCALNSAGEGDVVLVAGKGHEKFQIIGDTAIPFDDCEVVRRVASEIEKGVHGATVRTGN